jgi:hypothetical protein
MESRGWDVLAVVKRRMNELRVMTDSDTAQRLDLNIICV